MTLYNGGVLSFLGLCLVGAWIFCSLLRRFFTPEDYVIVTVWSRSGLIVAVILLLIGSLQFEGAR